MPAISRCLWAAFCALFLSELAVADVVSCASGVPPGVVCLSGDVSDTSGGGPLVAGQVYHVGNVNVPVGETLTVEGGAIVKANASAVFEVRGTLNVAPGAVFTSVRDDTAGGDTNGDSPETPPDRGDWDGFVFYATSDASFVDGASIKFAVVGLNLFSADITINDVTVQECSSAALDLKRSSQPTVTGCQFANNGFAVLGVPIEALPGFGGNTAASNDVGDYLLVTEYTMTGNLTIGPGNSLGSEPFVVCGRISVPAGLTLDLLPGTVIKFGGSPAGFPPQLGCGFTGIDVQGTLLADGVVVTSLQDDSVVGDTNKDGGDTLPAPGDWGYVEFGGGADASSVTDSTLRFGGRANLPPFVAPTIILTSADVLLDGVTLEEGPDAGLRVGYSSFPTVRNCAIRTHAGVAVTRVSLGAVAGFTDNVAADNGGDYMRLLGVGQQLVAGPVALAKENALNESGLFVVADDITILAGGSVTLGGGVVFKWTTPDNHRIVVNGTLVADGLLEPIVFTSLPDDAVVGDSNKDGGASAPAPGDWVGIELLAGSEASVLDNVVMRFAGQSASTNSALFMGGTGATLMDSVIERSETAALSLASQTRTPTIAGNAFRENDLAVRGVHVLALSGFSDNTASDNVNGDYLEVTHGDVALSPEGVACEASMGPASALSPDQVFVVSTDIDVAPGACLEILPGTIIKWLGNRELFVDGEVQIGGIGPSVAFTSIDDDSIGGDTRKDGFTEGAPGDWAQIELLSTVSTIEDALVRYAGSGAVPQPAVQMIGADTQLKDVRVEDCAGTALALNITSLPTMDGCSFERNAFAVAGANIAALAGFSNNSASDNTNGNYIQITHADVTADQLIQTTQSLDGRPFVVRDDLVVQPPATFTVDPGVVFKFDGDRRVIVNDTLKTAGGQVPTIIFTTLIDDIAGDTNRDGDDTTPAPGAWRGLEFNNNSDASELIGARIRFAGSFGPSVLLSNADVLVLDSLIERSAGAGLNLSGNSRPEVRRTSFVDGLGIPINAAPIDALPGFRDNLASGNAAGDYVRVSNGSFTGSLVIGRYNALNSDGVFVVDSGVTVNATDSLELRQGTIFKWQGSNRSLNVNGSVIVEGTGLDPVVLTSVADDAVGGDTLKDGDATVPLPGDWGTFSVNGSALPSSVENLYARYGGGASFASVSFASRLASARSVRSDFSSSDGVRASDLSGDASNWIAFQSGQDGIDIIGGGFDVVHATVTGSGGVGVRRSASSSGTLRNSIAFDSAGGDVLGFDVGEVFASVAGPTFDGVDGNIDTDPLFTGPSIGALTLAPASPCIDTADLSIALATTKDHREAPRVLDDDLDGQGGADMGALERAAFELSAGGAPRAGTTMAFTTTGAVAGTAVYFLGDLSGTTYLDPFGTSLYGPYGSGIVLGAAPVGQPLVVGMPPAGVAVDVPFGIQALVRLAGSSASGGMTTGLATGPPDPPRGRPPVGTRRPTAPSVPEERGGGTRTRSAGGSVRTVPGSFTNLYRARVYL